MNPLDKLNGLKTYLAAAGLFVLAVQQFRAGQIDAAVQSFLGGLAALGIRHAIAKHSPAQEGGR